MTSSGASLRESVIAFVMVCGFAMGWTTPAQAQTSRVMIGWSQPTTGATVSGTTQFVFRGAGMRTVRVLQGEREIARAAVSWWGMRAVATVDTRQFANGPLTLVALASNGNREVASPLRTFTVNNAVAPAIRISVSPTTMQLAAGASQSFTASISGTTNTAVMWSVEEAAGGVITTQGRYTAPASAGTYHIKAVAAADPTQAARATIIVVPPSVPAAVTMSPKTAMLAPRATQDFSCRVAGISNPNCVWSVQEANGGSIDGVGRYLAPATPGTYHVIARSEGRSDLYDSATVTVTAPAEPERAIEAMPLISRGKPTAASSGTASFVVDGRYNGWDWQARPTATAPQWVAIDVGTGPTQVVVSFTAWAASPPRDYQLETSGDSTNGSNGTWTVAATVAANREQWRSHSIAFEGKRWVRLKVIAGTSGSVSIHQIDVHDATLGSTDTWLFLGDSITATSYWGGAGSFAERIHTAKPTHHPLMINAGVGGTTTIDAIEQLDHWLAIHSHIQNWVLAYGTNDSANADVRFAADFEARLRTVVSRLQAAGKRVFIPSIPWKSGGTAYLPAYNAAIERVRSGFNLTAGPDLYAYFVANPRQLYDGVHPDEAGADALNRLWAEKMLPLYE